MNKIFGVELSSNKRRYCELDLPATDYQLLDALDQLQLKPGEKPRWEITEHTSFHYLQVYLDGECDFYQLNELSRRLEQMSIEEQGCFDGLFQIALNDRSGPISINDLFTYTENTDKCLVVDARDDEELGRFYVDNGFLPELEKIPEPILGSVLESLDYTGLGRRFREAEHGVYARGYYIMQHTGLKPSGMQIPLMKIPEYAFRLQISRYDFENNRDPLITVPLELPATKDQLVVAIEKADAASWNEVALEVEDSAIPDLLESMISADIFAINELAQRIKYCEDRGELPKLKAAMETARPLDVKTAIDIAKNIERYSLERNLRTPEEVAKEDIQMSVDEPLCSLLLKHANLHEIGKELLNDPHLSMTAYGLFQFKDCSPILSQEKNHQTQIM